MLYTDRLNLTGPLLEGFTFPEGTALFVIGDVHGQAQALRDLLDGLGRISTPGHKRVLVFLGDLIDRGPDSYGSLEAAWCEAASRGRMDEVHFLPGNHELLLAGAMDEAARGAEALGNKSQAACWAMNGGHAFMSEVSERFDLKPQACPVGTMTQFADSLRRIMPEGFLEAVRSWPSHYRVGDVLCVHAGIAPKKPLCDTLNLSQQSHWPTTLRDRERSDRHWAWIREKFLAWQGGWPTSGKKDAETGLLVVHGHSVAPGASLRKLTDGPSLEKVLCRAATNGRICLDAGSSRNVGVAAMVMTAEAHRLAFAPCVA